MSQKKVNKSKKTSKVNYILPDNFEKMLKETSRYKDLWKEIKEKEEMLTEKLSFTVEIDYLTLESLLLISSSERKPNISILKNEHFFLYLNDLSLQRTFGKAIRIFDEFIVDSFISNMKNIYTKNIKLIKKLLTEKISSFYLVDIMNGNPPRTYMKNICNAIKNDGYGNESLKNVCEELLIQYFNLQKYEYGKDKENTLHMIARIDEKLYEIPENILTEALSYATIVDHLCSKI